jgi:hypothetical protein
MERAVQARYERGGREVVSEVFDLHLVNGSQL